VWEEVETAAASMAVVAAPEGSCRGQQEAEQAREAVVRVMGVEARERVARARAAGVRVAAAARVVAPRVGAVGATAVAVAQAHLAAVLRVDEGRWAAGPSLLQRGSSAQPKTQMA
jgi:hypothetical protein